MESSGPASLSVNPMYLQDSIKNRITDLLLMIVHSDVLNICQSEVQFVFEVWGEGWIVTNFIDMAFSVVRFLVNFVLF
jgi:hypothetical protein